MAGPLDFIGSIADVAKGIVDKIAPDAATKLQYQQKIEELKANGELAQLDAVVKLTQAQTAIDLADSQSKDKFQTRARPFIMWTCGAAFATQYVLGPLVHQFYVIPSLDMSVMMPVLLGVLGLGGMRSFEKYNGVA